MKLRALCGLPDATKAFKLGEFQDSFELANKALEARENWDHTDHTTPKFKLLGCEVCDSSCDICMRVS